MFLNSFDNSFRNTIISPFFKAFSNFYFDNKL